MTTPTSGATLQDRFAESILQSLQEIAPKVMQGRNLIIQLLVILCGAVLWHLTD